MNRDAQALAIVRLATALIIAIHGWSRLINGGSGPFGDWLVSQGIPLGHAVAWFITIIEIAGTPVLALGGRVLAGRLIPLLAAVYCTIYLAGILMIHAKAGWFVVGAGRNGAEFSVLLILCLVAVGVQFAGRRSQ